LKWKVKLLGPGSSSPIIIGNRVFVTYWSGYGIDARQPGNQSNLKRHLVCIDRATGKEMWSKAVDAVMPEDRFGGMFAEHGYATHTPVSDGERVYVFFGKTGVLAFDLEGKQLWQTSVGTATDARRWGTSSSPILYKNLLIVPAVVENHSLVALDKLTGKVEWRQEAEGFGSTWETPALVDLPGGRQELVLSVPYEIWGFNPETGKLNWYCDALESDSVCSSVVTSAGIVYAIGGRSGSVAVRAGGKDDVTKTHVVWSGRARSRIGTPLLHGGRLYWINQGVANCIDAKSGESVYRGRLDAGSTKTSKSTQPTPPESRPGGRNRRRYRGGRGGQNYSSPIATGGKLYYMTRTGNVFVLKLGPKFEQLAVNRFDSDGGDFSATPAISNGELFIRSSRNLYCVADGK
jgi:outer membrane protein assembly factor BamB